MQFVPDTNHKVLDGTHLTLHKVHIQIKIAMVQLLDHAVFNDPAQQFRVYYKACIRVRFTFYGYQQFKIMPMPVIIGATSENLVVLLPAPIGVIELMGRIEMFYTCQEYHVTKEAAKLTHKGLISEICTMNILLIAATRKEIEPVIHYLSERIYLRKNQHVDVVVAGVGMMDTTYSLAKKFTRNKYTLAIQAGIGGSFHPIYAPGMVVTIKEDLVGDLGVREGKEWQDVFDMGLANANTAPWKNRRLVNPHKELLGKLQLECVRGITVNQVSTDKGFIQNIKDKYLPVVESMEGAAFHYVCLKESIPFIQIRGISNMVGDRDKKNWKMKNTVEALNQEVIKFLNQITDPY